MRVTRQSARKWAVGLALTVGLFAVGTAPLTPTGRSGCS
jgi:hypothetical protein